ncbi:unnamed protein product, partial [Phaeothamnion confervicola]
PVLLPAPCAGARDPVHRDRALPGRAPAGGRQAALHARHAVGPLPAAHLAGAPQAPPGPARAVAPAPHRPRHGRAGAVLGAAAHARRLPGAVPRPHHHQALRGRGAVAGRPGLSARAREPARGKPSVLSHARGARRAQQPDLHGGAGGSGRLGAVPPVAHHRQAPPVARAHGGTGPAAAQRPVLSGGTHARCNCWRARWRSPTR